MNETMEAGEPSYTTGDMPNTDGTTFNSGIEVFLAVIFLIIIISYGSYIYKRGMRYQSPLPPTTSLGTAMDTDDQLPRLSTGLNDDVLATFPTFLYSEVVMHLNGGTNTTTNADNYASGCSICLVDYKPADVIRLLPECGHLFHVGCIDTWLKVHPTCPVCRNSPLSTPSDLT